MSLHGNVGKPVRVNSLMPEPVMTKAQRLQVRVLHHDQWVTVADVIGDHDTYRVNVVHRAKAAVWCSCPSQVEACSHVLALAIKLKEQQ